MKILNLHAGILLARLPNCYNVRELIILQEFSRRPTRRRQRQGFGRINCFGELPSRLIRVLRFAPRRYEIPLSYDFKIHSVEDMSQGQHYGTGKALCLPDYTNGHIYFTNAARICVEEAYLR